VTDPLGQAAARRPAAARRTRTVRLDRETGGLWLGEYCRYWNDAGQIVSRDADLPPCLATDLQHVFRSGVEDAWSVDLLVSDADERFFDEKESPVLPVHFELHERALALRISFLIDNYDDEEAQAHQIAGILRPLLTRHRTWLLRAWPDEHHVAPPWLWHVRIGFHTRGWSLAALLQVGQDAVALMDAGATRQLTRTAAGDLVRGGQAHLLIGQPEGHWLDVKAQQYPLDTTKGQSRSLRPSPGSATPRKED